MSKLKIIFFAGLLLTCTNTLAQDEHRYVVRLAKLVIDSVNLDQYNQLLKEGIETAIREEPGVLTLYAVAEQRRPTHITILEIYANEAAYRLHIKTTHFLKYKEATKHMVKSLELIDTNPLIPDLKIK